MSKIKLTVGQFSSAGCKTENEDSWGILVPEQPLLGSKGIAIAIADGASGSEAGKEASEICIRSFLDDYYCTHDAWTVETSVGRVLTATNRWLYAQGEARFQSEHGLVSTLSGIILKDGSAHIFHVGDSRILRIRGDALECLTTDHTVALRRGDEYLKRGMGLESEVQIDYRKLAVNAGDVFVFITDGVHRHLSEQNIRETVRSHKDDLQGCASTIANAALKNGSTDNLTCQIVRVDEIELAEPEAFRQNQAGLPFPPDLEPGNILDGFEIIRQIHASRRSQVYLARDQASGVRVALKTPSSYFADDPDYIDQFTREDWIARRLQSPHVVAAFETSTPRTFLYSVQDFVEGQTLRQWMDDHPGAALHDIRPVIDQIARGLRAFHRLEMQHRDLKPDNIMIDRSGTIRIIDFGSTRIVGLESEAPAPENKPHGTVHYTAPEYVMGHPGSSQSDLFSLGLIAYEMLTGSMPYGDGFSSRKRVERATLIQANEIVASIPDWVSRSLSKALEISPANRYQALSEFTTDLAKPNPKLLPNVSASMLERNPTAFWRRLSILLLALNALLGIYALHLLS